MKKAEKNRAIVLRKEGLSLKEIVKILNVSKASVSTWVRDVALSEQQISSLGEKGSAFELVEKRRATRLKNEMEKREKIIEAAKKEIDGVTLKDLRLIGIMLYWAEGGKTKRGMVRFSNSNPEMIAIMMKFFKIICGVKKDKFRGHIHTHSHLNAEKAEEYWQKISGIPKNQFFKTYSKPSKASKNKKDSLPFGTFDIYVCDTALFLKIVGWTRKIVSLVMVPPPGIEPRITA